MYGGSQDAYNDKGIYSLLAETTIITFGELAYNKAKRELLFKLIIVHQVTFVLLGICYIIACNLLCTV